MGRAFRLWLSIGVLTAGTALTPPAFAQEGETITGDALAQLIEDSTEDGPDFESRGLTVTGDLDLRSLRSIDRPLRCVNCAFEGSLSAADVEFGGIIDLSGSTFGGAIDLRGAVFGRATIFDGAVFAEAADFGSARFTDIASFAGADFLAETVFDRTVFEASASFIGVPRPENPTPDAPACASTQGAFLAPVSFEGSLFSDRADVRGRCFQARAAFNNSAFLASADFASARFLGEALMEGLDLRSGASFRVAEFAGDLTFEGSTTSAALDFEGAIARQSVILESISGTGTVSLDGFVVQRSDVDEPIEMRNLFVAGLSMDVPQVNLVSGPNVRKTVLSLIEETARERGQTSKANKARFELLSAKNEELRGVRKAFDSYLYRDVAGYLVRPTHPMYSFLILLLVGTFVRAMTLWRHAFKRWRVKAKGGLSLKRGVSGVVKWLDYFFTGLSGALASAFGKRPYKGKRGHPVAESPPVDAEPLKPHFLKFATWTEFLSYKALIAVFVLGVGNANSTIQELIDTVF